MVVRLVPPQHPTQRCKTISTDVTEQAVEQIDVDKSKLPAPTELSPARIDWTRER